MLKFGEFRLDARNECVWRGEEMLALTPRPFAVLRYLVEHPQCLVTHDEMLEALWPETYVQPQVLRTYILELRKLLGDDPVCPRYIQTVPRRGYRFMAAVADAEEADAPASNGIVGRAAELKLLAEHLKRVRNGERATLFITGEPGIGKTALLDAFCAANGTDDGLRVARGQSIEGFAGKESLYPVREAVNEMCSADEAKARPAMQAAVRDGSASITSLCETFETLAANRPLLLIFEDIHWADRASLDLIGALARRRSRAKLMLVATYRPADLDAAHPLRQIEQDLLNNARGANGSGGSRIQELRLAPLDKESVREYLRRQLGAETLPPGLTSLVHQHSAGNALFMTAVLDHLKGQNLFRHDGAELSLRVPIGEIDLGVPDGLAGLIEFQLEKLSEEDRRLLEAGSVAGTIFPAWAVAAALELELEEIEERFAALVRRVKLVSIAGYDELPGGGRSAFYVFSHALYREALYTRLPSTRRAQWHRRVAERLRTMFAGQEENVAVEIAAHVEAGK
ncbi:ATP-binding protein [Silvibacterium sp.]|uniref:ATP-binding protein n=1 Tax=Silvibacterium sp. TaxID=1964179 RepID=UPI0039E2EE4D